MQRSFLFAGISILASLVIAGCSGSALAAPEPAAQYAQPGFREIIKRTSGRLFPSLVYIKVIQSNLGGGRDEANAVSGSGVIISADGELLTNYHVIDKATEIRCLLFDGRHYTAKVIGSDKDLDLALIKLELPTPDKANPENAGFPHAKLCSTPVGEGDFVMAMGAPLGLARSVTMGIISCSARALPSNGKYTLWYQTDAAILPGNSGGPLVNTNCEVVGLNTLGMAFGGGMGFTLPSSIIIDVLPRLRKYGKVNWAWFGFQLQPLNDFNKNIYFDYKDGVVVSGTDPGSPARLAGVLPNDRIISIDGKPVSALTPENIPGLRRMLGLMPFDKPVTFSIERPGVALPMTLSITPREKGAVEGSEVAFERWGFSAKAINRFDNPTLHFYAPQGGIFIFGIDDEGNAARSGLSKQDIILSVDGKDVSTPDSLQDIYDSCMKEIKTKTRVTFGISRNGRRMQIVLNYLNDYKE